MKTERQNEPTSQKLATGDHVTSENRHVKENKELGKSEQIGSAPCENKKIVEDEEGKDSKNLVKNEKIVES